MLNIDYYTTWPSFIDIACIVSEIWRGNHNAPHDYKSKKGLNLKLSVDKLGFNFPEINAI